MSEEDFDELGPPRPRDYVPVGTPEEPEPGLGVEIINWRDMYDGDAPRIWQELDQWVRWFIHRYAHPPNVIPECWWRHGAIVEELSALRTLWLVSFDSLDTGAGPVTFHEHLEQAITRLTRAAAACQGGGGHQPRTLRPFKRDAAQWQEWITTSHARDHHPVEDTNERTSDR